MLQHLPVLFELHMSGPSEVYTVTLNNNHPYAIYSLQVCGFHLAWKDLIVSFIAHEYSILYW